MVGDIVPSSDSLPNEPGCRSVANKRAWSCRLTATAILVIQILIAANPSARAAELPTIDEITQESAAFREASSNVQGQYRIYREDKFHPEAFDKSPSEMGLPLTEHGDLWRSKERFRANFASLRHNPAEGENEFSVAIDGENCFQLSKGRNPDLAVLHVYDIDSPQSKAVMTSIRLQYYAPLDALWSSGLETYAAFVRRSDAVLEPSQRFPGGYSILISTDEGNKARCEFTGAKNHPFGFSSSVAEAGALKVKCERLVLSVEKDGIPFPSQITDVLQTGPDNGHTQIVVLDLEPLQDNSPIAQPITSDSFHNAGFEYQVYQHSGEDKVQFVERYNQNTPSPRQSSGNVPNNFRTILLWVIPCLIMALLALLIYRRKRR
jgi:hypothetical protein